MKDVKDDGRDRWCKNKSMELLLLMRHNLLLLK